LHGYLTDSQNVNHIYWAVHFFLDEKTNQKNQENLILLPHMPAHPRQIFRPALNEFFARAFEYLFVYGNELQQIRWKKGKPMMGIIEF